MDKPYPHRVPRRYHSRREEPRTGSDDRSDRSLNPGMVDTGVGSTYPPSAETKAIELVLEHAEVFTSATAG